MGITKFITAVAVVAAALSQAQTVDITGACKALSEAYPRDTTFPHTSAYDSLNVYFVNTTVQTPQCIFTPRSANAAAFAIRTFTSHKTIFAIRSGGHNWNSGFSSTSSGVLLDLLYLNEITYRADSKTVKIGTGNTWGTVYKALEAYGVTVPGGRASPVGVGGLSLGGGLNFYLYEYGFTCDNIVEYEVVTASGKIITVTKQQHPDLFLALKGSGAPFALVTSFTFKAIPAGKIWGGSVYGGASTVEKSLEAVAEFMAPGGGIEDLNTHLISVVALQNSSGTISANVLFYRDDVSTVPKAYENLVASAKGEELANTLSSGRTIADLTTEIGGSSAAPGPRQRLVPWTVKNPDAGTLKELNDIFHKASSPLLPKVAGFTATVTMIPLGYQAAKGKNVIGLEKGVNYLVMSLLVGWTEEKDDLLVRAAVWECYERITEYLKKSGKLGRWIYMNYADADQDPIASYGRGNVEKLRKVQEKYDHTKVWERLVKGGFKIPK